MPTINGKACVANGRNLLTGTGNHTVTGKSVSGYLSNETTDDLLTLFQGLGGQTVTVSVDYEYSGFIAGSVLNRNRLGWQTAIFADELSRFSLWYSPNNDSGSGRMSVTFVVPENIRRIDESMGYIQFSGSGTGTLSHLKLEKGSVATPLTPAPVDKVFSNGKQVYGRNLVMGSYDSSWGFFGNVNPTVQKVTMDSGEVALHVISTSGGGGIWFRPSLQSGNYTASVDVKGTGKVSMLGWEDISMAGMTPASNWQRVSRTGSIDSGTAFVFYGAMDIYVRFLKIEKGTIATPWTPAPEDVM